MYVKAPRVLKEETINDPYVMQLLTTHTPRASAFNILAGGKDNRANRREVQGAYFASTRVDTIEAKYKIQIVGVRAIYRNVRKDDK